MSTNGQDYTDTLKVFRYYYVRIDSVNPAGSPLPGRVGVVVMGIGFLGFAPIQGSAEDTVRLRMAPDAATIAVRDMTDTRLVFNAPAGLVGRYTLGVTLNNLDWDESGWDGSPPVVYDYYNTLPIATDPTGRTRACLDQTKAPGNVAPLTSS